MSDQCPGGDECDPLCRAHPGGVEHLLFGLVLGVLLTWWAWV